MPRHTTNLTIPPSSVSTSQASASSQSPATGLADDQVIRWAELIAAGRSEIPGDLTPADTERLEAAVAKLLRERMVGTVARAIAAEIFRDGQGY